MQGWTEQQCAEHWGVRPATWRAYVARDQAPKPIGYDETTGRRVWDPDEVTARRPGAKRKG